MTALVLTAGARALVRVAAALACAHAAYGQPLAGHSDPVSAPLRLTESTDRNSHPQVVEVEFTAKVARVEVTSGRAVEAWTSTADRLQCLARDPSAPATLGPAWSSARLVVG